MEEATRIRDELLNMHDVDFAYANNAPHYLCPRRKLMSFHFRKSTKVEVFFDAHGYHFMIVEKLLIYHSPNILNAEVSSSKGSVYSVIDEEMA